MAAIEATMSHYTYIHTHSRDSTHLGGRWGGRWVCSDAREGRACCCRFDKHETETGGTRGTSLRVLTVPTGSPPFPLPPWQLQNSELGVASSASLFPVPNLVVVSRPYLGCAPALRDHFAPLINFRVKIDMESWATPKKREVHPNDSQIRDFHL